VLDQLLAAAGASTALELRDKSGHTPVHVAAVEMQVGCTGRHAAPASRV